MEAEDEVMTGWKDLPVELLMRVMSLLDDHMVITASSVCGGWRVMLCCGLTNLRLSWCKNHMNSLVQSLVPKFTRLVYLTLAQNDVPQLEDNAVETIANFCHDLKELDISKNLRLTDRSLYTLGHGCPHLTKLNISDCSAFSDTAVAYLSVCCRNLKNLNLCGCVKAATDRALQTVSYHCKGLESLNLGWCESVTDEGVTSLAVGCPDLRVLDLCECVLITDESVIALSNNCPRLRSLDLYNCQNISNRAMHSLVLSRAKSRRYLGDDGDDIGLTKLNISQCTRLTASAVQAVCNAFPGLHTCPEQQSLIISGCQRLTSVHCDCVSLPHHDATSALADEVDCELCEPMRR